MGREGLELTALSGSEDRARLPELLHGQALLQGLPHLLHPFTLNAILLILKIKKCLLFLLVFIQSSPGETLGRAVPSTWNRAEGRPCRWVSRPRACALSL